MPTNYDEVAKKYGGVKKEVTPTTTTQTAEPGNFGFMERLKMSFGGAETAKKAKEMEKAAGLAGKWELGDIADVIGGTIPVLGGILGSAGGLAGVAGGTMAGETVRRSIGKALGVREGIPVSQEIKETAVSGAATYIGGKAFGLLAKAPGIKQGINFVTKSLPERFYSTFFKTTADDLAMQMKTGAMAKLQATNPEMYNNFVKAGIIKMAKGKVTINPTLAKQALEKGLGSKATGGGSLEKMAEYSYVKQIELEALARNTAKSIKTPINLGSLKKGYMDILENLFKTYDETGYGFLKGESNEAKQIYNALKASKTNSISVENALKLRRTLDSLRSSSSFRLNPKLSEQQSIYKIAADRLRGQIARFPQMKSTMNDYKFWIDAADSLVTEASRRGNTKIFGLFDAVVGGTSLGVAGPIGGVGLMTAARTIQSPVVLLYLARALASAPEFTTSKITPLVGVGVGRAFGQESNRQASQTLPISR